MYGSLPFYHRYVRLIFIIYNYLERQFKTVVKNTTLNSRLSGF